SRGRAVNHGPGLIALQREPPHPPSPQTRRWIMSARRNGSNTEPGKTPPSQQPDPGAMAHLREAQEHLSAAAGKGAEGVAVANLAAAQALLEGVEESGPELRAASSAAGRAGRSAWSAGEAQAAAVRDGSRALLERSASFVRERPV